MPPQDMIGGSENLEVMMAKMTTRSMMFYNTKKGFLDEINNVMDAQEVPQQTREESALVMLNRLQESDGFKSLFDTAHMALHDVYLDSYFDDIFRDVLAGAIEKTFGG
jgi:hypothetical protein